MKIDYQYISIVFRHSLSQRQSSFEEQNEISKLLFACIEINKKQWALEDLSRMHELGFEAIAKAKMEIDTVNQKRNETINELDLMLDKHLSNTQLKSMTKFQSESPGMLIDRIAILFIRHYFMEKLIPLIEDNEVKNEYLEKEKMLSQNIDDLGLFLNSYFDKIENREAFFKVYKPLKIYNDDRIKHHIRLLNRKHSNEQNNDHSN